MCCLATRLHLISTFCDFQYGFKPSELRVCWQTWVGTSLSDWVLGRSEAFRCEALCVEYVSGMILLIPLPVVRSYRDRWR